MTSADPTEIPPPTPELTLIGAHMRALMQVLPARKRRLYLESLVATLEEYEGISNIIRLRGREHDAQVTASRRAARAWVKAMLSAFFRLDIGKR